MHILMRYGKKGLSLDLPCGLETDVIRKRSMPVLKEPAEAIRSALSSPVGCKPLKEAVRGRKEICVLICDNTRPLPHAIILPALIDGLIDAGAPPDSITMLIATGLHRPNEGGELRELIGSELVLQTVKVVNHFARNDEDHVLLGNTPRKMPVRLDRRFMDAEVRIAVGLVEPHFMAGYSGGRKLIVPGVAHEETIKVLHSTRMLDHERVANCMIDGNPLHEEQLYAVEMAGGGLALNTVIDEDRNLSFVNFGEIVQSHLDAIAFARPYFEIPVPRRYKTVITSAAGYPLDRNYYQTVKGMVGAAGILEPGGDLIIVSECSEGLGTVEYAESQGRLIDLGMERFLEETSRKKYASIDEWESVMQVKAMRAGTMHLYCEGLTAEEMALTGVNVVGSIEEAVEESVRRHNDRRVAVIPEGPYVIPVYRPES
ncbi:MAG TPA: nickel-dependent lactate racemase [Syntrophorhabdaceae bacterium]|nr:nickel-dependent lactate racemase [Syntrophorhabdaceae bacterium]HQM82574.1 nickel-dependent lactate racemase [Syntrophorhabdaceae bacterium]